MNSAYLSYLSILTLILIVIIAIFNNGNTTEFSMFINTIPTAKYQISTQYIILSSLAIGFVCGLLFMLKFVFKGNESIKAYERRLEKTTVSNDSSSAKIKVLESKIQVLEKALEDALKNK